MSRVSVLNFLQIILKSSKFLLILPQICFKFYLAYFALLNLSLKFAKSLKSPLLRVQGASQIHQIPFFRLVR